MNSYFPLIDAALVYGDTNSTLAGALAAVKLQIPVAHVKTNLRSFNMTMPEEVNRSLTDRISRWLFTPTDVAEQHLAREGFAAGQIIPVGDVMYDVALHHGARVTAEGGLLHRLGLKTKNYLLATIHRAENTDHPKRLAAIGRLNGLSQRITLIEPVGYLDMVQLEKYAALIATDSGGVQKEAFFYQVPCVTLRDETEWVELVEAGWNRLAPPMDAPSLRQAGQALRRGDAAQRIVQRLAQDLGA